MITPEQQQNILKSIRTVAFASELTEEQVNERKRFLVLGALVGLQEVGQSVPPHWIINIQCHRIDRLFAELEPKAI